MRITEDYKCSNDLCEWVSMMLISLENLPLKELAVGLVESLSRAEIFAAIYHLLPLTVGPESLYVQDWILTVLGTKFINHNYLLHAYLINEERYGRVLTTCKP